MALQGFVDKRPPVVSADWLNSVDFLKVTYDRTAAEVNAAIVPANTGYPPGDLRRYGAILNGVADDRPAWESAYAQFKQGGANIILPPNVTSFVSKNGVNVYALRFDSHVILNGNGNFTLKGDGINNYTLIYATGGTNVRVDVKGMIFNAGKVSPNRPVDNDDICLRIQSSIDTVNVEDNVFMNYNEDGVYFNAVVNGVGGRIHNNRFTNGARSAVTLVQGQYISITQNDIKSIQLSGVVVQATDINTVCRQISVDFNRFIGGGTDTNSASDRTAIFVAHVNGATSAVMGQYTVRGNVIKDFGVGYAGAAFAFGIETRECTDILVSGNEVTGCKSAGLYSFLTIRAAYFGNLSTGNDKGLWMNSCTNYSEGENVCLGNITANRDYHGPDGATSYQQAEGLTMVLARASVSFVAGAPTLNSSFGISAVTDLGVGDTRFTLADAVGNANFSVCAVFRSFSGTTGLIQSASHVLGPPSTFRVVTFNAGVASDESYDFIVMGTLAGTTDPP